MYTYKRKIDLPSYIATADIRFHSHSMRIAKTPAHQSLLRNLSSPCVSFFFLRVAFFMWCLLRICISVSLLSFVIGFSFSLALKVSTCATYGVCEEAIQLDP